MAQSTAVFFKCGSVVVDEVVVVALWTRNPQLGYENGIAPTCTGNRNTIDGIRNTEAENALEFGVWR